MSTISCGYRIYPAWFGGDSAEPIAELANGAADRLGRTVDRIETTGHGFDRRGGHFIDFKVTYSSTGMLREAN